MSPLSPCTHADFLLGQKLGRAPACGAAAFSSKGCGRSVSGAWEGGAPELPGRVGILPAGMLLPSCPHRRNLVEEVDARYMKTCLFHKTLHPLCPVFKLGYVVQESGQNFSTLAEKV